MNNEQVLDLFVDQNVLQKTQADDVLTEAQQNGKTIVQAMVDGGFMDESGFYRTVAEGIGAEFIDLNDKEIGPEVVKIVPAGLARLHRALPVELVDGTLRVALADPLEPRTAEDLRFALVATSKSLAGRSNRTRTGSRFSTAAKPPAWRKVASNPAESADWS